MRSFIYHSIVNKLGELQDENSNPVIRHFDLNNGKWKVKNEKPVQETVTPCLISPSETEGISVFCVPAVFIEFAPIEWRHRGNGIREACVRVMLHIIAETGVSPFLDLPTGINCCLHGHTQKSDSFVHGAFRSVSSITGHDCADLCHYVEIFVCHATDLSVMRTGKKLKRKDTKE